MLDVGSVARHLLDLRSISGGNSDQALAMLVALHDIGKISASFRNMLRMGQGQKWRHWEHSAVILRDHDDLLAEILEGSETVRQILYEAVAGHHGGPRERQTASYHQQQLCDISSEALSDAKQAIRAMAPLFKGASLQGIDVTSANVLSWHLNGLVVQSDWIGSNPDWFPPTDPDVSVEEYWQRVRKQAKKAVSETRLHAVGPARSCAERILPNGVCPHPMQASVLSCDLPDGPVLAVIEDATGAGKTEAALIFASRLMQAGQAEGLFFALPTMATANAMLSRVEVVASVLFNGSPTLGLAHGRAHLSAVFHRIKGRVCTKSESGPNCGRWLADDRRRILLSDIGIGTIDQALFAVLPTRFNALRLRVLSRKVLIVDEAHSYDPYMGHS